VVKPGQEVEVKILRVDTDDRKIGLSLKRAQWGSTADEEAGQRRSRESGSRPTRGGMDDHGSLGTSKIKF
jgi:small subunit ribosomal protein S1